LFCGYHYNAQKFFKENEYCKKRVREIVVVKEDARILSHLFALSFTHEEEDDGCKRDVNA